MKLDLSLIAVVLGMISLVMMMGACANAKAAPALRVGDPAPEFSLSDQEGKTHSLKALRGSWVMVYFYPKDDTPGCTRQACALRDRFADFTQRGVHVFGINPDSVESHKTFAIKHKLTFPLLSDADKSVVKAYGVWGRMAGMIPLTMRSTFLINPEGAIAKIYEQASPDRNADEILADLDGFGVPAQE
jgi:peroxiredoxin Q/BCP